MYVHVGFEGNGSVKRKGTRDWGSDNHNSRRINVMLFYKVINIVIMTCSLFYTVIAFTSYVTTNFSQRMFFYIFVCIES